MTGRFPRGYFNLDAGISGFNITFQKTEVTSTKNDRGERIQTHGGRRLQCKRHGRPVISPARHTELARRQLMVRVTVVPCVTVPDVPLRVSVCLPMFAPPPTVMVTVACAELVPLSVI